MNEIKKFNLIGKLPKLFFEDIEPGYCYTLDYFIEKYNCDKSHCMNLEGAKMCIGEDHFYCKEFGEVGESTFDCCGKTNCKFYDPRNGKNGRCKHHRNTYEHDGRKFILELKEDPDKKIFYLTELQNE